MKFYAASKKKFEQDAQFITLYAQFTTHPLTTSSGKVMINSSINQLIEQTGPDLSGRCICLQNTFKYSVTGTGVI